MRRGKRLAKADFIFRRAYRSGTARMRKRSALPEVPMHCLPWMNFTSSSFFFFFGLVLKKNPKKKVGIHRGFRLFPPSLPLSLFFSASILLYFDSGCSTLPALRIFISFYIYKELASEKEKEMVKKREVFLFFFFLSIYIYADYVYPRVKSIA